MLNVETHSKIPVRVSAILEEVLKINRVVGEGKVHGFLPCFVGCLMGGGGAQKKFTLQLGGGGTSKIENHYSPHLHKL